jgi:ARG and Rhodanese-Phosphatase-superfamily-associated Protein domain
LLPDTPSPDAQSRKARNQECLMTTWNLLAANLFAGVSLCLAQFAGASAHADTGDEYRLSGPAVHGNLAIYFVHGKSRGGPVPLTLAEALAKKTIVVRELGEVNELQIENTGSEEIFVQSGDIVKGGQQDRVLSVSLLLKPHSGPVSIASFCVEQGRWSARGGEDVAKFSSASASLPSRSAKIALAGSARPQAAGADAQSVSKRQREIWNSVSEIQGKLSSNLGAPVAAPASRTSLQLALENGGLARAQAEYVKELQPLGEKDDDIVGYVFAVNGKLSSADIYPSNALFRKMWPKLLVASATEAITEHSGKGEPVPAPPPVSEATGFLATPHDVPSVERNVGSGGSIETRESAKTLYMEAKPAAAPSAWVHRNYLAK